MTDILVRDVDPALARSLKARARANERSLSDEVKAVLERDFAAAKSVGLGTELRSLIPPELWTDDLIVRRDKEEREPPDFS